MNHKPRLAWELYLKMETSGESFSLLQLIANDCYKVGWLCNVTSKTPSLLSNIVFLQKLISPACTLWLVRERLQSSYAAKTFDNCFVLQMGQFYYAAKAFDVLERLDPNPEYWEGKRGACVGIFQQIIAGHEPRWDTHFNHLIFLVALLFVYIIFSPNLVFCHYLPAYLSAVGSAAPE